jgi:transposase
MEKVYVVEWTLTPLHCLGYDEEKKLIRLREQVNRLYFAEGYSKNTIAKAKKVSKHFVIRWTQSMDQDFTEDHRGWPKGQRRRWSKKTEQRIGRLRTLLKESPDGFYWGPTAIAQEWLRRYPDDPVPPLRSIGQILKDLGLSEPRGRKSSKGAARYLCYPEHTIYEKLGNRVMESDFVGHKYIKGNSQPINFVAFSFKKSPRLRHFQRVEAQNADCFIEQCQRFFKRFEKPDCIKLDNAAATIGSKSRKRTISRVVHFLLANQVVPIFAVPRKPFSQASVEGNNSVFARKFWNRRSFNDLHQIDIALQAFNKASEQYSGYQPPSQGSNHKRAFMPKVYFIRQVRRSPHRSGGFIDVLNESISLARPYINYFVLAEWNLKTELLRVYFEKDQSLEEIKKSPFPINQTSKEKSLKTGALSSCN